MQAQHTHTHKHSRLSVLHRAATHGQEACAKMCILVIDCPPSFSLLGPWHSPFTIQHCNLELPPGAGVRFGQIQRRIIHPKKSTQNKKVHLNKFFLNNFRGFPDLCHREEGSSRELFKKVRVNAVFLCYFGILGEFWGL